MFSIIHESSACAPVVALYTSRHIILQSLFVFYPSSCSKSKALAEYEPHPSQSPTGKSRGRGGVGVRYRDLGGYGLPLLTRVLFVHFKRKFIGYLCSPLSDCCAVLCHTWILFPAGYNSIAYESYQGRFCE
jgi:hypothetical protein